jgi:hypothetical protein
LPFLQQESTFWRKELNEYLNFDKLQELKLAGDYYMWYEFSKHYKLNIVETYLGGFRKRDGQLSGKIDDYYKEMMKIVDKKIIFVDKLLILFDSLFWTFGDMIKIVNKINPNLIGDIYWFYCVDKKEWIGRSERYI